jgi:hypothetical protein
MSAGSIFSATKAISNRFPAVDAGFTPEKPVEDFTDRHVSTAYGDPVSLPALQKKPNCQIQIKKKRSNAGEPRKLKSDHHVILSILPYWQSI